MSAQPPSLPSTAPGAPRDRVSIRRFAVYVLFASLTVLFTASLVAYFVTRTQSPTWRTPGMPALPVGLWVSTLVIAAVSACLQGAVEAARKNRPRALEQRLWVGAALAVLFLAAQFNNWSYMHGGSQTATVQTLYPFTFYLLTGLHAAHVLGGFFPLGIVLQRAHRREYSSSHHEGVDLCVLYWHYLGVVWVVLFATLELFS